MTRLFLLEYPLTSLSVLGDFCRTPLQTIRYTYDPVGNITQIYDESQKKVFTNNQGVAPEQNYVYDSLYRLLEATGREHNALSVPDYYKHTSSFKQSQFTNINDASQLSNYTRHFEYDKSGNLTQIQHVGNSSFTREIAVDSQTNRAILRETTNPIDFNQFFDPNGNCTQLENIAKLAWNYRDNISRAIIIERTSEPDDAEYYVYDAKGARVRKIKETYKGEGVIEIEEKVYLGSVEIKRIYQNTTPILERSTLHVLDDKKRIAIAHNWTQDDLQREVDSADLNTNKLRYQYENHLGSSSLELNSHGQIISYEEYFPYGGTSFIAGTSQREVKLKEYRYCAKERDDSTGLYYYGFRYYAPWLGRWMSADPKGQEGSGINMYWYASSNPINRVDEDGREDRNILDQAIDKGREAAKYIDQKRHEDGLINEIAFRDFYKGESTAAGIGINAAIGILPPADIVDTVAAVNEVANNPKSLAAWIGVGLVALAFFMPGIGDAIKGGAKAGTKVASEVAESQFTKRQLKMLKENVGYNVSPNATFEMYDKIGKNGTFITDYNAIENVIGDFKPGAYKTNSTITLKLEKDLGLTEGSLVDVYN